MKKLFEEIRKQNTPNPSLDEMILAEAEKLKAGSKLILSEKGTEQSGMNISINKTENSSAAKIKRNYGAFIAAAAAIAIVGAGAFTVINLGRAEIKPGSEVSAAELNEQPSSVSVPEPEPEPAPEVREVKEWAKEYLDQNPDTVGYIHIPGFDGSDGEEIDYPVVQRDGDDWEYYLDHSFDGSEDPCGSITAVNESGKAGINENGQPQNIVLYGNSAYADDNITSDGSLMFTGLKHYQLGNEFFSSHNIINFKTIYEDDAEYAVFAVFNHDADEQPIFTSPATGTDDFDFDKWITAVKNESYFECDMECTADDSYLTLVCPITSEDADYFRTVVAKKITENDTDTQPDITESSSSEAQTESSSSEAQTESSSSEAQTESSSSEAQTENSTAAVSDPVSLTLNIPLPDGLRGVYTIDVYRDGNVAYTKTIGFADYVFTDHETIDIMEKYTKQLVVYIRSEDLGQENYIRYATYNINYENGTCELVGEPNYSDLLAVTPAE